MEMSSNFSEPPFYVSVKWGDSSILCPPLQKIKEAFQQLKCFKGTKQPKTCKSQLLCGLVLDTRRETLRLFLEPATGVGSRSFSSLAVPKTTKPHIFSWVLSFLLPHSVRLFVRPHFPFYQPHYGHGDLSFSESFLLKFPSAQGSWEPADLPSCDMAGETHWSADLLFIFSIRRQ